VHSFKRFRERSVFTPDFPQVAKSHTFGGKMIQIRLFVLHPALLKHPGIGRMPLGRGALPHSDGEVERRQVAASQMIAQVTGR
jgi:hypothetical protein